MAQILRRLEDEAWSAPRELRDGREWPACIETVRVRTRALTCAELARVVQELWVIKPPCISRIVISRAAVEVDAFINDPCARGFRAPAPADRIAWERQLRAEVRQIVTDAVRRAVPPVPVRRRD